MSHLELLPILQEALRELMRRWTEGLPPEAEHASLVPTEPASELLRELALRLADSYPFGHPHYAAQMLKPPHPIAWAAYALAMVVNPNNHALDGGPATTYLEREAVAQLARLVDWPEFLGHLTGGGTVANLEALFIARELHPERAVAVGDNAHYTHRRMAHLLGLPVAAIPMGVDGTMALEALEAALRTGRIGTVVATLGTTGMGALDPIHEILRLARRYGARVHVDGAYGGYFALLARRNPPEVDPEPFRALVEVDSFVVDPHKHGLQPYGCGAVLFRDPSVGRFYRHDSPYTYFTSRELHLGEVSLECSRAGAAAAALWTTLRAFPLEPDRGMGPVLAACRRAAQAFYEKLERSERLRPVLRPQLDIVLFGLRRKGSASELSAAHEALFQNASHRRPPVYVGLYRAPSLWLRMHWPDLEPDAPETLVLRVVLMRPEQEQWIGSLLRALEAAAPEL
ncbi:MAG: aminotransferase class V-fold PLP-dependent enzyme [Bacteroidota bacterium]|nr:aminotransferase class V-fold PLP-dependent enzyme [Rhodothermia bacterium]MDW8284847.1 aminotransferase class V-fold PLP-dependent enzyme [Bacteroidota bacterium]